ncbi:polysaccharide lyase [Pseudaminobacter sp. NGMCC 1.201702]|uniref:polysaccharide lyase n=1 Tax=Pseudaminobacter sp. NGMCC 1.201702 TaxID=3391825 RepID=UPI0039F02683
MIGLAAVFCIWSQAAAPASQVLRDGFDGSDFSAEGGLYYRENFEQSAGTVEFQRKVKRDGAGAIKLSVKPVCPASSDGCSERAEIWEKTELRVPYDEGVWYGFSIRFVNPIPRDDHRFLVAQWKREIEPGAEGDFSPFLALRMRRGKLFATVETNYLPQSERSGDGPAACAANETPVWLRPETNQMRALVAADPTWVEADGELFQDCTDAITVTRYGNELPSPDSGWIDFAVFSKPGPDGTGHIELLANGKPIITVKGHIGHADKGLGKNQYFKFGPYRAAHSGEWTLYYDEFRRSPHCADVLDDSSCPVP